MCTSFALYMWVERKWSHLLYQKHSLDEPGFIDRGDCVSMWDGYCISWISLPCPKCNAGKLYCNSDRIEVLVYFLNTNLHLLSSFVVEISFHYVFWLLICFTSSLLVPFLRFGEILSGGPHFPLTADALKKVLTGQASWEVLLSVAHAVGV